MKYYRDNDGCIFYRWDVNDCTMLYKVLPARGGVDVWWLKDPRTMIDWQWMGNRNRRIEVDGMYYGCGPMGEMKRIKTKEELFIASI